jgi:hypothetical protein
MAVVERRRVVSTLLVDHGSAFIGGGVCARSVIELAPASFGAATINEARSARPLYSPVRAWIGSNTTARMTFAPARPLQAAAPLVYRFCRVQEVEP